MKQLLASSQVIIKEHSSNKFRVGKITIQKVGKIAI